MKTSFDFVQFYLEKKSHLESKNLIRIRIREELAIKVIKKSINPDTDNSNWILVEMR